MTSSQSPSGDGDNQPGQLVPVLCLIGVVVLLSSITPVMKNIFQRSAMNVFDMTWGRVGVGFLFLAMMTACLDWRGLRALRARDGLQLGVVGVLGVGSYAIAAWGLMYTSVTHYALLYSLLPTFTALFSCCFGKVQRNPLTWFGIPISWIGCVMAVSNGTGLHLEGFGVGDGLVLLFTLMMSAHIVLSANIVRRHGILTSNTAMFGTCAVLLSVGNMVWGTTPLQDGFSLGVIGSVCFIGVGTAGVFLLRCRSLRSLSPSTVGAYHNLIPICTIGVAHFFLGEPLTTQTILGAIAVIAGTELVRRAPSSRTCLTWPAWSIGKCAAPLWAVAPAALRSYSRRFQR